MRLRTVGEPGNDDRGPLQALGCVHGRQLDRVRLADPASLQAELLVLGGGQVGEERAQRGLLLIPGERRRSVSERVQVGM